mgnify:CR=1 FL=1
MKQLFALFFSVLLLSSCSENYSNGERIGMVTQFSKTGIFFKSYEGHLNVTQTGMNSSVPFDFSIDNDRENPLVIATLDSAANYGWKVKLIYHETMGWNWFSNRGETNHFITEVQVLDKGVTNPFSKQDNSHNSGIARDTIYLVIFKDKK